MTRALVLLAMIASCSPTVVPPAPPPLRPPPEPRPIDHTDLPVLVAPQGRLPTWFVPTRYKAGLSLDPSALSFRGAIEITGTLTAPSGVIWLNAEGLTIHAAEARSGGKATPLVARAPVTKLIGLQAKTELAAGEWTIRIEYSGTWNKRDAVGGFRQIYRGAPYVFTQFEPDYARQVFPCIDEPDRKVPWQLTITAPEHLVVASNTPMETRIVDAKRKTQVVSFAPTLPLPSYLVAFAVGPFTELDAGKTKGGTPVRILSLYDQPASAEHGTTVTTLVDQIEAWVGVAFPYPKLDVVVVPRTADWWYAMENAGLVTIRAEALTDPDTWDRVMAHEIAHHWFGNLVTMAWWDDLWLNEAFAEWVAVVATKRTVPVPQTVGTYGPVVSTVFDPRLQFSGSARERGPALLTRFASFIGLAKMQSAITQYLQAHPHGTVTTQDFSRALDAAAGQSISPLLADYLTSASSTLDTDLECKKGAPPRVTVTGLRLAEEIVCVAYERNGKRADQCHRTTRAEGGFALDTKKCPRWFLGEDISDVAPLVEHAWPHLTERERHRIFTRAIAAGPDATWSVLPLVMSSSYGLTSTTLLSELWQTRPRIDDAALLARYDAWVLDQIGTRARTSTFDYSLGYAAIGALAGDPTLLAKARSLMSAKPSEGSLMAAMILTQLDVTVATAQLEKLLTDTKSGPDEIRYALQTSPFLFELIKKNAQRIGKNEDVLNLLPNVCSVPYQDIVDLVGSILPFTDAATLLTGAPLRHATCSLERQKTTAAVRTYLDALEKKASHKR